MSHVVTSPPGAQQPTEKTLNELASSQHARKKRKIAPFLFLRAHQKSKNIIVSARGRRRPQAPTLRTLGCAIAQKYDSKSSALYSRSTLDGRDLRVSAARRARAPVLRRVGHLPWCHGHGHRTSSSFSASSKAPAVAFFVCSASGGIGNKPNRGRKQKKKQETSGFIARPPWVPRTPTECRVELGGARC